MSPSHTDLPDAPKPTARDCQPTRQILDRVADKWSLYVITTLQGGPRRVNELKREIEGISQRMLTLTLRGLERDGLITRTVFPTIPPRVDYELTDLGRTLLDPVMALVAWAEKNKSAIAQAQRRFEEEPKPEQATIQWVVYQRL